METVEPVKKISVVAAILYRKSERGQIEIFSAERNHGQYKGFWEFPGGKIEAGETPEQALSREITEELSARIKIEKNFITLEYTYPTYTVHLQCFLCRFIHENFSLNEHARFRWLALHELETVQWLPADITILLKLKKYFAKSSLEV